MTGQLVEGIGDEVLLFGAFLFLSLCMVGYVSLRGGERRPQRREGAEEEVARREGEGLRGGTDQSIGNGDTGHQSQTTTSNGYEPTATTADHPPPHHQSTTLRSRFPQPQAEPERTNRTTGTGQEHEEGSLPIRLILPTTSLSVNAQPSMTLGELRRIHFQEELAQNRPVRFIYQGRVLEDDNETLQELGIVPHNAIHLHIGRPQTPDNPQNAPQPPVEMLDLSFLFFPLFGLILAVCWVSMFCFPHVFSLLTKVMLFLLSLGYMFLAYTSTRTTPTE